MFCSFCGLAHVSPLSARPKHSITLPNHPDKAVAQRAKFVASKVWADKAVNLETKPSSLATVSLEGLTAKHLTPTSGAKHIPIFMLKLPQLYSRHSMPIVDGDGLFKMDTKTIKWSEVAARTHGLFDVLLGGQSPSVYSKQVLGQLHSLLPDKNLGLKRLKAFVHKVDQLSAPWLPLE